MIAGPEARITRPSVEFNVTEHCNLACYGCGHASPVLPEGFLDLAEFTRDFEALRAVFHSDELRVVGGEPLLHPRFEDILAEARRIGVADRIVVYTNGVLLHEMATRAWELIDELLISAYPGVRRRLGDDECAAMAARHGVRLDIRYMGHFDQVMLNERIQDDELVGDIYRDCKQKGEWSCHIVRYGRFYKCPVAAVTKERLRLCGVEFDENPRDGVQIAGNPNLREELAGYLADERPLAACAYCLGSSGPSVPHRQMNRAAKVMWLQESHSADIEWTRQRFKDGKVS
jgi:organic radical activating enzyme